MFIFIMLMVATVINSNLARQQKSMLASTDCIFCGGCLTYPKLYHDCNVNCGASMCDDTDDCEVCAGR